jgi:transposase InsO family protein
MYEITLKPRSQADHWRALAEYWHISQAAKQRLEWLVFYYSVGKQDAAATAGYFGISRKTFHKWKARFNPQVIQSLEEKSRAPINRRTWEVTRQQEQRIIELRNQTKRKWGKAKLKALYQQKYHADISTWKIERVVKKHQLYPDLIEKEKQAKRLKSASKKTRIHQARKEGIPGPMWHLDTVIIWWYGVRKVIFTALEDTSRLAFARVYTSNTSTQAVDFLSRLTYLSRGNIAVIHSDNGGEFAKSFIPACKQLNIKQIYSRNRTPKDNPQLERFNRTLQEEWLAYSEVGLDEIVPANHDLTEWLVEYNSVRPHQALDYKTPLAYAALYFPKVLPMSPART